MRIIITADGKKEISKLSNDLNLFLNPINKTLKKSNSSRISSNHSINSINRSFKSKISNNNIKKNEIFYSNVSSLNHNLSYNPTIKNIILQPLKLNLSKKQKLLYDIGDKYEKNNNNNNKIIKQSNYYLSSLNHNKSFTFKSNYSLGEIVNKKIFKKLKNEIETKEKNSSIDKLVDHTSLRKEDKFKDMYDEIEEAKKKEINVENYNLIYYLINKNSISRKYLKNLSDYNDIRINRLNKICKIIDDRKNEEKTLNNILKEKMKARKINDSCSLFTKLNKIKNNIENANEKFNSIKPLNKKLIFNNIHNRFVSKYWERNNNSNKKRNYSVIGSIYYNPIKCFLEKYNNNIMNFKK
jgi:hypothetical protein